MTVCIGAICADQSNREFNAVVVCADRMVTMGHLIEFEHEIPKVKAITNKIVTLMAGDAIVGAELGRGIDAAFPAVAPSVERVAEKAAVLYATLRDRKIETEVFRPRGMTRQEFYARIATIPQPMNFQWDQMVMQVNLGVDVIVAGVDDAGGHLFAVANPGGTFHNLRQIGFHAIGSGALHAVQSMIGFGHTGNRAIPETLFAVYAAKRRAEAAPGVGRDTDMSVVTTNGTVSLTREDLDKLGRLYEEFSKPLAEEVKKELSSLSALANREGK